MNAAGKRSARNKAPRRAVRTVWAAAIVACLGAMAVCTATGHLLVSALLLAALLAAAFLRALAERHRAGSVFIALNLVFVVAVLAIWGPEKAMGLTLAIAEAVVGTLFLRSLRPPGPDLITRIACAIQPERSRRVRAYTRRVCWGWAALMLAMAAVSLLFTFVAPPRLWLWWRLVGSWAIPVAFFVAEWLARQWILRGEPQPGFRRTLESFTRIDYPRLFEL